MKYAETQGELRRKLAAISNTDPQDWHPVYRARYGMQVVFETIAGQSGGGSVITQSFNCVTAINPIIVSGLEPHYADIAEDTLSIRFAGLSCPPGARALVAMHCFGLPADMAAARRFCDDHDLVLMEDSAHCLGRIARDDQGQPLADISVHSFGAEKMLGTKFGGAIWINPAMKNSGLAADVRHRLERLPLVSLRLSGVSGLYGIMNLVLNKLPARHLSQQLRTSLASAGLLAAPIAPVELRGKQASRPARPAAWMIRRVLDDLERLPDMLRTRQEAVALYHARGSGAGVPATAKPDEPYVRFPLIMAGPDEARRMFDALRRAGVYPGRWYFPTLFPGVKDARVYAYDPASCPTAEGIAARIINLPTDIPKERVQEVCDVVFG